MKTVLLLFTAALLASSTVHAQSAPPPNHPKATKHHAHKAGKHGKHHHKRHQSA